jgi:hypothetical protein
MRGRQPHRVIGFSRIERLRGSLTGAAEGHQCALPQSPDLDPPWPATKRL